MPRFPCEGEQGSVTEQKMCGLKKSSALMSWEIKPWETLESIASIHSQRHTDIILLTYLVLPLIPNLKTLGQLFNRYISAL